MNDRTPQYRATATVRIVAIYVLFGLAWIYGSDTLLGWVVRDPELMVRIAVVKGSLFILCTAVLLFFLIDRFARQLSEAEQQRAEALKEYRTIFNAVNEAILVHDARTGCILDVNDRMLDMYGYSRAEALSAETGQLSAGIPPYSQEDATEMVRRAMFEGPQVFEWRSRRKSGELFWSEVSLRRTADGRFDRIIAVVRDISERKRATEEHHNLERQLLHAQKLESLGILAGGIAHDFNNILMAIIGNADLALLRLSPESPAMDNLRNIVSSADRAAELARQMLAYSGRGKFVVEHIDLNLLLEEMLNMLQVSISKKAHLRLDLKPRLPSVEVDVSQIRQVVMNLIINASEAIGENSGCITVSTDCRECDQDYLGAGWLDEKLEPGAYVFLEVADSGCGMDDEVKSKIFDPFFSTKFSGRGLGMAAVLGIVRGHRGAIRIKSEPQKGSTFTVLLPASDKPAEAGARRKTVTPWKGAGTVLLADDEEAVRDIGSEMLRVLGFEVITAGDGMEALELFKKDPDIPVVLLDLTMPKMDGEQCFRELKRLNPNVKVVLSSGYSEQEVTGKFPDSGLAGFIQKPYQISILADVLKGTGIRPQHVPEKEDLRSSPSPAEQAPRGGSGESPVQGS